MTTSSNIKDSLPTDPKLTEAFLFGYSRFFAKPNGIFRLLLQHDSFIAKEDITEFGRANITSLESSFSIPPNMTQYSQRLSVFLLDLHPPLFLAKY